MQYAESQILFLTYKEGWPQKSLWSQLVSKISETLQICFKVSHFEYESYLISQIPMANRFSGEEEAAQTFYLVLSLVNSKDGDSIYFGERF